MTRDTISIRHRAHQLIATLRDCGCVDEKAAARFLDEIVSDPPSDAVLEFCGRYGQSLDWLLTGDLAPMIRDLRRQHDRR
jgi:hypothetical protein